MRIAYSLALAFVVVTLTAILGCKDDPPPPPPAPVAVAPPPAPMPPPPAASLPPPIPSTASPASATTPTGAMPATTGTAGTLPAATAVKTAKGVEQECCCEVAGSAAKEALMSQCTKTMHGKCVKKNKCGK